MEKYAVALEDESCFARLAAAGKLVPKHQRGSADIVL